MARAQDISIKTIMINLQEKGYKVEFQFWPRIVTVTDRLTKRKYQYASIVEAYKNHR